MRPKAEFAGPPIHIYVQDGRVVVPGGGDGDDGDDARLPAEAPPGREQVLGSVGDRACIAVDLDRLPVAAPLRLVDLRELHGLVPEETWALASRAVQAVAWDRDHRFCGHCGTATEADTQERVRRCPNCGLSAYPRVSPAIIVLVTRGERDESALLAWGRRRATPFYSLLAGFVEPGEDLEQAVAREVLEETAVEVTEIAYHGSQPWPFPNQLMVGFRARYASGEIRIQESEIVQAHWFSADEVQRTATPGGGFSIAGELIDGWLIEQRDRDAPEG